MDLARIDISYVFWTVFNFGTPMEYYVEITEDITSIQRKVNQAVAAEMNLWVRQNIRELKVRTQNMTAEFFKNNPTFSSLAGNLLEGEFGFYEGTGQTIATKIVETIGRNIEIKYKPFYATSKSISGNLTFYVLKSDFKDILSLSEASYISNDKYEIKWLEWLLLHGDEIIITDYQIKYASGAGRSKQAIMIHGTKGWRVPRQFSGTIDDNFLTRELVNFGDEYVNNIGDIIKDMFK